MLFEGVHQEQISIYTFINKDYNYYRKSIGQEPIEFVGWHDVPLYELFNFEFATCRPASDMREPGEFIRAQGNFRELFVILYYHVKSNEKNVMSKVQLKLTPKIPHLFKILSILLAHQLEFREDIDLKHFMSTNMLVPDLLFPKHMRA